MSLRPDGFVRYVVLQGLIAWTFLAAVLTFTIWGALSTHEGVFIMLVGIYFAFVALGAGLSWAWAVVAVRRYHYWLTDQRLIWCHGFIGYSVRSVPLERVSDVSISRSLIELLAGITSIGIRDMTGQMQQGTTGESWIGVRDAPEVQKRILEEIKKANAHAKRV